jgi:hypothetical protein
MAEETRNGSGDALQGEGEDLQFSSVEGATPQQTPAGPQCAVCRRPIENAYFTAGDKVICPQCREQYEASLRAGSKAGRLAKATLLGTLAGLIGAAVWFGIRHVSGYDFALVAIGVGLLVGGAVRKGSGGRGGRGYQLLAVLLTYLAVGFNYAPDVVIAGYHKYREMHQTTTKAVARGGATTGPASQAAVATTQGATTASASGALDADDESDDAVQKPPTGKRLAIAIIVLLIAAGGVVLAGPVLVAFSSIIGALIVGFALWEAWKINASRRLALAGPYSLAGPPPIAGGPDPNTTAGPR